MPRRHPFKAKIKSHVREGKCDDCRAFRGQNRREKSGYRRAAHGNARATFNHVLRASAHTIGRNDRPASDAVAARRNLSPVEIAPYADRLPLYVRWHIVCHKQRACRVRSLITTHRPTRVSRPEYSRGSTHCVSESRTSAYTSGRLLSSAPAFPGCFCIRGVAVPKQSPGVMLSVCHGLCPCFVEGWVSMSSLHMPSRTTSASSLRV